jgi:hypothetical protein
LRDSSPRGGGDVLGFDLFLAGGDLLRDSGPRGGGERTREDGGR